MSRAVPRKCKACDRAYPETKTVCPACRFPAPWNEPCVICKSPIPEGAKLCNECQSYQGRLRRHFPISGTALALLGSIITVFVTAVVPATSYLLNLESRTRFKVTSADNLALHLTVWNTGQKPSVLIGCRLNFGKLPIEDVALLLADEKAAKAKSLIQHGDPVLVRATVEELNLRKRGRRENYTREDIVRLLADNPDEPLTLNLDVEESNDSADSWQFVLLGRDVHTRKDTFPVHTASQFILWRMSR